jgi:2,3-bisphosphoglycerate-independent phosphoglycerate mutase
VTPRVLLLFIDGIGLGDADPAINPFAAAELPTVASVLDGRSVTRDAAPYHGRDASLVALDATLGVAGLPQSGTGQTALFTGKNAAQMFGRHFGPWVPTALREVLANENVLARAAKAGRRVAFANAYPEELFTTPGGRRNPLRAGPPIAAIGAGVMNRHTDALMRGDAVASEIINDGWRKHLNRRQLPVITAEGAGRNLGNIAAQHDLTLFAHYSTDAAGHNGSMEAAVMAIERVDAMLAGLLQAAGDNVDIIIASDHGNLEDVRVGHTHNPAVGLFIGRNHVRLSEGANSLVDVTPRILHLTNAE